MGKVKKGVKKFQKKQASGGVHKKKKLHFRRDNARAAEAAKAVEEAANAPKRREAPAKPKRPAEKLDVDDFLSGGFESVQADSDVSSQGGDSENEDALSEQSEPEAMADDPADVVAAAESTSESDDEDEADPVRAQNKIYRSDIASHQQQLQALKDQDSNPLHMCNKAEVRCTPASADEDEADPVKAQNKKYKSDIASHQEQLQALKEQDPEFYTYLQQTDQELLNFGQDADEEDEEEQMAQASEDEREGPEEGVGGRDPQQEPAGPSGQKHVSSAMVDAWCKAAKATASPGAMHKLLQAYRLACHYGDSEEQVHETMKISSSAVFSKLMLFVLKEANDVFMRMLSLDSMASVTARDVTRSKRLTKADALLKSFFGNSLHLLGQMTDSGMLTFALRRLRTSVVLLAPFLKLQRKFLKLLLTNFGGADKAPRLQAFLFIRSMAALLPAPCLQHALKGVYRTFVQNAKFVNAASVPHIHFMGSCVVEMFGLDMSASYEQAFTGIRQLAVLLRGALTVRSKEGFREVYCWQTVNCLELWAKVLAAHADKQDLRPLVYPLTQVLLGTVRLVPTPRYFPLRLRCIRALMNMGKAVGQFIPLSPVLLEMLQWGELSKRPQAGAGGMPDMALQLRVSKNSLKVPAFQEEVVSQVIELLAEHLGQWACSIAFPELAHLPLLHLRRFAKQCKVERFRTSSRALADALERNMVYVAQRRQQVDFSPKDTVQVNAFLKSESETNQAPLQKYAAVLREKAAQRRAMRSSDEVQLNRKTSVLDGASDSEDEDERPLQQSQEADDMQQAAEDEGLIEPDLLPKAGSAKAKTKAAKAGNPGKKSKAAPAAMQEDGEDVLQDYELSDDESDED